ncbi:MAG: 50S ribosomal protein L22 [Candidatus Shapirobacteria bacterium]
MEIRAESKNVRISPRKVRLVAELIKEKKVELAMDLLKNLNKAAAEPLRLTLKQGIGNAVHNFKLSKESLVVKSVEVGEGVIMKRWRPVSRGQAHSIKKRTSQIKLVLSGEENGSKS